MMRTILGGFALLVLLMPAPADAQPNEPRARVIQEAPLVLLPDARRVPLRVAAVGTSLVVIGDEGEWLHIQFQDPQYGLRTGYVQRKFVEIQPRQVAIDPSTRSAAPQAAPVPHRARISDESTARSRDAHHSRSVQSGSRRVLVQCRTRIRQLGLRQLFRSSDRWERWTFGWRDHE